MVTHDWSRCASRGSKYSLGHGEATMDKYSIKVIKWPLNQSAKVLNRVGITANQITYSVFGRLFGVSGVSVWAIWVGRWSCIIFNRVCDGLDGALARIQVSVMRAVSSTSFEFPFLFTRILFGFVIANPEHNAIAGAFLIFSFIGTGSSFLAFAVMAGKRGIENQCTSTKSRSTTCLALTEGTRDHRLFHCLCIWPQHFAVIAYTFGAACWLAHLCVSILGSKLLRLSKRVSGLTNDTNKNKNATQPTVAFFCLF